MPTFYSTLTRKITKFSLGHVFCCLLHFSWFSAHSQSTNGTYTQIAAGVNSSLAMRADGQLWAWGLNTYGQLGDGTVTARSRPVQVLTPTTAAPNTHWTQVAMGGNAALALRSDGTLWAWGDNGSGELGNGSRTLGTDNHDALIPTAVLAPTGAGAGTQWTSISMGLAHVLAIRSDGTLWSWGDNSGGQLGINSADKVVITPQLVPSPVGAASGTRWIFCAAGPILSFAIRSDGTLWSWGRSLYGFSTLGHPSPAIGTYVPELVPTPATAAPGTSWISATSGGSGTHTLAIRSDGTLWGWGWDRQGELGLGSASPAIGGTDIPVRIPLPATAPVGSTWAHAAVSEHASLGLLSDGSLWGWGYNIPGFLGLNVEPISSALPTQEYNRETWTNIAMGSAHSVALSRGQVYVAGSGSNGQLGLGNLQNYLSLFIRLSALPLASNMQQAIFSSLYPNPATSGDVLTAPGMPTHTLVFCSDMRGRHIATLPLTIACQFTLPSLTSGLYILSFKQNDKIIAIKKIVIN